MDDDYQVADPEAGGLPGSQLPVVVLVGRPNVGKSTLFNVLTQSRDALVADFPGLTRDRQYGVATRGGRPFLVVDTGGMSAGQDALSGLTEEQSLLAVEEADLILFLVDYRGGNHPDDLEIARSIRSRLNSGAGAAEVRLVVNKAESVDADIAAADFYSLGFGQPLVISAAHGQGINTLIDDIHATQVQESKDAKLAAEARESLYEDALKIAIVGRPNVGKSTLVNRLVGESRVLASDVAGTTRDSVAVPIERDGQSYVLIDTAGLRRRGKVQEAVEKFSIVKTLQAVEQADVVLAMVDAQGDIGGQDARILGLIAQRGRSMILAVNKWDCMSRAERSIVRNEIERKLPLLNYAPLHCISALHGSGLRELFESIEQVAASASTNFSTSELTRVLEQAVQHHPPPSVGGRAIRLRYAHQGGENPPTIIIHGNRTDSLPDSWKRYLANVYKEAFDLVGTPVKLIFKSGDNPYEGKKNKLTPTQARKRKRMLRHVKR